MNNLLNQFKGMEASMRVIFIVLLVVITSLLVMFLFLTLKKDYQPLYADLNEQDTFSVIEKLEDMGVDYKIERDGALISVKDADIYKTRLQLAGEGVLLSGGAGFELFDEADYGMTQFTQKINYQRALQGELARTIMVLGEVKFSRVHLMIPDAGLFIDESESAKAAVTLVMKSGRQLSTSQIRGIQRLVASAVEGLPPTAVDVLNEKGELISSPHGEEETYSLQMTTKKRYEEYFLNKIDAVLSKVSSDYKPVVSVDITLSYDEIKTTKESFESEPNGKKVVVSSKEVKSLKESGSKKANTPPSVVNETTEYTYQVGREVEEKITRPGFIRRITVGILLPASVSEKDRETIERLAANVIGINSARGDSITVSGISSWELRKKASPVESHQESSQEVSNSLVPLIENTKAQTPRKQPDEAREILFVVGAGLLITLIVFFLWMALRKSRSKRNEALQEIKSWLEADFNAGT